MLKPRPKSETKEEGNREGFSHSSFLGIPKKVSERSSLSPCILKVDESQDWRQRKQEAIDLLDMVSKSGLLEVDATVHVICPFVHNIDQSIMDMLVDSIDPMDENERNQKILHDSIFESC